MASASDSFDNGTRHAPVNACLPFWGSAEAVAASRTVRRVILLVNWGFLVNWMEAEREAMALDRNRKAWKAHECTKK